MQKINTLLNNSLWNYLNDGQNRQVVYLSPISGSKPGWYFWLHKNRGVYEMILLDWLQEEAREESAFCLKYYPDPDEEIFSNFSCAEQVVRLSNYFDDTEINSHHSEKKGGCACSCIGGHHSQEINHRKKGFPRFHDRKNINASLFTIGEIIFSLEDDRLIKTQLSSQDQLIQYAQDGINVVHDGKAIELVRPGEQDRKINAWELCWTFYQVIFDEVLAKMGKFPQKCIRETQKGLLYYQSKGGDIWSEKSELVTRITHAHYY